MLTETRRQACDNGDPLPPSRYDVRHGKGLTRLGGYDTRHPAQAALIFTPGRNLQMRLDARHACT